MAYPRAVADDHPTHHDRLARGYPGFRQAARPHGYPPVFFRALGSVWLAPVFSSRWGIFLSARRAVFFSSDVGLFFLRACGGYGGGAGLRSGVCLEEVCD